MSFTTDAVLALPTKTSEMRLFELDNGTMSQARLAREVWDYERYAGHRVWEGARGTNGRTFLAAPSLHPLPDLPAAARRPGGQGGAPTRQPAPGAHRRRPGHRHRDLGEHPAPAPVRGALVRDRRRRPDRRRQRSPEPAGR
ncbi:replication-relaxation family protein [Streptomyces rishiriensis]|uniref:replication-relaxation family protein n=1 Tax=Streptomyces rishiriensis TaxID=68264 RepID=UPI002481AC11